MSEKNPDNIAESIRLIMDSLGGLAEINWTYFTMLKKQGFTDGQALKLTGDLTKAMMSQSGGTNND